MHFLEQATFGPTAIDVASVQGLGPQAWLTNQFQMPESLVPDGLDGSQLRAQVYLNMATGPDQVRQRAMFALSQIVVVSANKVGDGAALTPWVRLLSRNAFGNYRTLLREVSLSPTMGKYLDNVFNRKATATASPNENYARELLQLFSVGVWELNSDGSQKLDGLGQPIPTYSQATIAEYRAGPDRMDLSHQAGRHAVQLQPGVLRGRTASPRPRPAATTPRPRRC